MSDKRLVLVGNFMRVSKVMICIGCDILLVCVCVLQYTDMYVYTRTNTYIHFKFWTTSLHRKHCTNCLRILRYE